MPKSDRMEKAKSLNVEDLKSEFKMNDQTGAHLSLGLSLRDRKGLFGQSMASARPNKKSSTTENTPQFSKKLSNSKEAGLNGSIGNLVSRFNEDKTASRDSVGGANTPRLLKRSDKISQLRESLLNSNAGSVERTPIEIPERRPLSQLDNKTIGGSYNNLRNLNTEASQIGSLKDRMPVSQKAMLEKALGGGGVADPVKSRRRYRRADTTPVFLNVGDGDEMSASRQNIENSGSRTTETSFQQQDSHTITTTTNSEFSQLMTSASTATKTSSSITNSKQKEQSVVAVHDPTLDTDVERKQITEPMRARVKAPGGRRLPSRFQK